MKKGYLFVFIAGLFLFSYILEVAASPLTVKLTTPYEFLKPDLISRYPFTAIDIAIKSLAIFLTPVLAISLINRHHFAKGIGLLVLLGLVQLYTIQQVATDAKVIPLEWTISLALASLALLLPALLHLLLGLAYKTKQKLSAPPNPKSGP